MNLPDLSALAVPPQLRVALRLAPYAAILLLLAAIGAEQWRIASLKASHDRYVAGAERARADAVAAVLGRERAAARISQQREETHEKTITDLRAAAARRLQLYTGKTASVPRLSDAPFQPDASAGGNGFLRIATGQAVALMLAADENTQQLIDLQEWIRAQQRAAANDSPSEP